MFGTLAREQGVEAVRSIKIEGASDQVREAIDYVFSLIEEPPAAPTPEKIRELLGRNFKRARQRKKARA